MPPLVSCIIPVRDGERFLAAALDSMLAQDHRPLEIIVVDDGSTDASAVIAEGYGNPVRVIRQPARGIGASRQRGIEASEGTFVSFLDADDLSRPFRLSVQLAELEAHPDALMCLCHAENFWEPGLEAEELRYRKVGKVRATHHPDAILARRELFARFPYSSMAGSTSDDLAWFARVHDSGVAVRVLDDVLVDRRMHAESHSHSLANLDAYLDFAKERIARHRTAGHRVGE